MFRPPRRRRIYLMRHAEAAYVDDEGAVTSNERQVSLTDSGRAQARKQAAVLASISFDRAICSSLRRTQETATLILAGRDAPTLEAVAELDEIRPADSTAQTDDRASWLAQVANPWAHAQTPGTRFLGGESFRDFDDRVHAVFDRIVKADDWTELLLMLHGAVNRTILNHVLNLPWQGQVSIEQDNCCLNIIDVEKDEEGEVSRYLIRAVNLTGYNLNKSGMMLTTMEQVAARLSETIGR